MYATGWRTRLWLELREVAAQQNSDVERALDAYRQRRHEFAPISAAELRERLTRDEVVLLDVRLRVADGIWAMGDVTARGMFTHVALHQSAIIAAALLGEQSPPARYDAVPRVTFTDPEIAAVGLTEAEAWAAGLDVAVAVKRLPYTFRGWLHVADGVIKLVVERESGVLVGATVAGPHAGEVLGLLNLAVHARLPLAELRSMMYAFPTFYGGIGEAVGASGRGLATVLDPAYQGFEVLDGVGLAQVA